MNTKYEIDETKWTCFRDMYSGGRPKTDFNTIWVNAQEKIAAAIFKDVLGRNPDHVTCECCGPDFYYDECREYDPFDPSSGDLILRYPNYEKEIVE